MKKILLVFGLTILTLCIFSSVAFAGTTTADTTTIGPHGAYTANTDACGQCHSTHTAQAPNLLGGNQITITPDQNPTYQICIYCHSLAGSSKYDEVDGMIKDGDNSWASSAGGVVNMPSIQGAKTYAATTADTSRHIVDGLTAVNIPGGNQSTADSAKIVLTCSSCHDPHGTTNARQLKTVISVLSPTDQVTTVDTAGIQAQITNPLGKEKVLLNDRINDFCGACHTDYLKTTTSNTATGTYNSNLYRHPVGMSPGQNNPNFNATYFALPVSSQGNVTCLTCHYSHGTTATVSSTTYSGSTLMRMDERGVCQNCHRMTPSQVQPTIQSATLLAQDRSKLFVTFDNYMYSTTSDSASVTNAANYTVTDTSTSGTVTIQVDSTISPSTGQFGVALQPTDSLGKSVIIPLKSTPAVGDIIEVTVTNVRDLNGVTIADSGSPPASGYKFTFTVK